MDDRLDLELRSLADWVAFPPTPDVRADLARRVAAPAPRRWWPSPLPRALVLATLATLLVVASVAALALLLPGLRLTPVPTLPTASVPDDPIGTRLALGGPVAVETVGGSIPADLGTPDEAYVLGDHEVLSLVYAADETLPEMAGTEIGLLVQVIDGALDHAWVEKLVLEGAVVVTAVEVAGSAGYWISGPPHLVRYRTPAGLISSQSTRLVGDTLVWERDGVLFRIESGLGLDATLAIAESIEP